MTQRLILSLIIFLCAGGFVRAQNLVRNPSFEQITGCPTGISQIELASPWKAAGQTPDLFHQCGFYVTEYEPDIEPFDGQGIASIGIAFPYDLRADTIFREFVQGEFSAPMRNETYFFSMRILADPENRTDNLGVYFSPQDVGYIGAYPVHLSPQFQITGEWVGDYGAWKQHCGCIDNVAGSRYFVIGNFSPTLSYRLEFPDLILFSNRIYIDQVELRIPKPIFEDTTILVGNCIDFSESRDSIPYIYTLEGDTLSEFCPNEAGTYTIIQKPKGCDLNYRLTIEVIDCGCDVYVPNVINISGIHNNLFGPMYEEKSGIVIEEFKIWDRWGSKIFDKQSSGILHWDGARNGQKLNSGVFIYSLRYSCCNRSGERRVVNKTGDVLLLRAD